MLGLIADHLWQSTMFAAAVALVALALRGTSARIRYWVWLAASVKFLVPFAALVAIGRAFGWLAPVTQATFAVFEAVETYGQPFSRSATDALATAAPEGMNVTVVWPYALGAVWLCGVIYLLITWGRRWHSVLRMARRGEVVETGREVAILGRVQSVVGGRQALAFIATDEAFEPGVFGIQRPALLWPRSLGRRLSDAQIEAILTHEWAHVRGYDNLTALLHMLVRALFWFHPVVLWIGARLVAERERACDEEVVRLGSARCSWAWPCPRSLVR